MSRAGRKGDPMKALVSIISGGPEMLELGDAIAHLGERDGIGQPV